MATHARARLFWSGASQAVRLPRAMRLPGKEVVVRRCGKTLILEPLPEADDWSGFWDRLVPLDRPVRRWKTKPDKRRAPLSFLG